MKKNRRISAERKEINESGVLPEQVLVAWGTLAKLPQKGKGLLPGISQAGQAKGHGPGSREGLVGAQPSHQSSPVSGIRTSRCLSQSLCQVVLPTALRKDFTFSVSCRSDNHCHKALLGP